MRKLDFPLQVHKDHVSAVISLDYNPTGREFVSAGYDKTIRIWNSRDRRSKEVFHTKRMQRLTDVLWSNDSRFIISSSDEFDIRIWKANASEKLGFVSFSLSSFYLSQTFCCLYLLSFLYFYFLYILTNFCHSEGIFFSYSFSFQFVPFFSLVFL